jgi:enoyl-CoA hydratase/carnithine racemase
VSELELSAQAGKSMVGDGCAEGGVTELVRRERDGDVAVLTMQSTPHNLLSEGLIEELLAGLEWVGEVGARAVVLRSGLRHFSAGADLDAFRSAVDLGRVPDWDLVGLLRAFESLAIPIVASVHGVCVGGGFELALASDLVVVAESAKLGSVESTLGLHPLMGAIQRITERAGAARAKEMAMLGRRYDPGTLERWGLINRVVADEQLETATMTLAQELAHGPTVAHAATKALVAVATHESVRAADEAMAELQVPIWRSEDLRTGLASFAEAGPGMARFEGR